MTNELIASCIGNKANNLSYETEYPKAIQKFNNFCQNRQSDLQNFIRNGKNKKIEAYDYDNDIDTEEIFIVKCHYPNCDFKGHLLVLDNHIRVFHDARLDELDVKGYMAERKKHFPFKSKMKKNLVVSEKSSKNEKVNDSDPMSSYLSVRGEQSKGTKVDLLGLNEAYGSSASENSENEKETKVDEKKLEKFSGLPLFEDLSHRRYKQPKNKFNVPISPAMAVHMKRNWIMNINNKYFCKKKIRNRPRIMDALLADDYASDSNQLVQIMRFFANINFGDETVEVRIKNEEDVLKLEENNSDEEGFVLNQSENCDYNVDQIDEEDGNDLEEHEATSHSNQSKQNSKFKKRNSKFNKLKRNQSDCSHIGATNLNKVGSSQSHLCSSNFQRSNLNNSRKRKKSFKMNHSEINDFKANQNLDDSCPQSQVYSDFNQSEQQNTNAKKFKYEKHNSNKFRINRPENNNAELNQSQFNNSNFDQLNKSYSELNQLETQKLNFNIFNRNRNFNQSNMNNPKFNQSKMNNSNFNQSNMNNPKFNQSNMNNSKFNQSNMHNSNFNQSNMNYPKFNQSNMNNPKFNQSNMHNSNFNQSKKNKSENINSNFNQSYQIDYRYNHSKNNNSNFNQSDQTDSKSNQLKARNSDFTLNNEKKLTKPYQNYEQICDNSEIDNLIISNLNQSAYKQHTQMNQSNFDSKMTNSQVLEDGEIEDSD